jgi:hypothetical protein
LAYNDGMIGHHLKGKIKAKISDCIQGRISSGELRNFLIIDCSSSIEKCNPWPKFIGNPVLFICEYDRGHRGWLELRALLAAELAQVMTKPDFRKKNDRRCSLIKKKDTGLSKVEVDELYGLQDECFAYLDVHNPLPTAMINECEAVAKKFGIKLPENMGKDKQ